MSDDPRYPPRDPGQEVTRVSRSGPPHDPGAQRPPPAQGGGGRGWMLATVTIIALLLGIGAGFLINGGDEKTKTVRTGVRTVVSTSPAQTVTNTTVTQEVRTVERTVTVTVPAETTDTESTATDGG